ncbi:hypothetical protein H1C71_012403, partial [Ictidomys tridecemlineatus]
PPPSCGGHCAPWKTPGGALRPEERRSRDEGRLRGCTRGPPTPSRTPAGTAAWEGRRVGGVEEMGRSRHGDEAGSAERPSLPRSSHQQWTNQGPGMDQGPGPAEHPLCLAKGDLQAS